MCIVCQTAMAAASVFTSIIPVLPDSAAFVMPQSAEARIVADVTLTPSKAGSKCARAGTVRTVRGGKIQCSTTSTGLRWVSVGPEKKKAPITSTTSTSSTTTTIPYRPPTVAGDNSDLCKLRDQSTQRRTFGALVAGFPNIETNFASRGVFKIALIPIDFADLPGDSSVMSRVADQMQLTSDWFDMVSEGRVSIQWQTHQSWVRVSGKSTDFALNRSRSDDNRLAVAAFSAADPVVDFSGVRAVYFVLPAGQTFMTEGVQGFLHSEFGGNGGYATAEGRVYNYGVAGAYFDKQYKNYWSYWAHEMGHMFPLPDLYDLRSQWWIGLQLEVPGGPFSGFDLMANQDGPSRTLSGWLRFVMGWLDDAQVFCKPFGQLVSTEVSLIPIDERVSGVKTVFIPVSDTKIVVVESRRANSKFDCEGTGRSSGNWRARNGVIVYTADMRLGHGEGFQALVAPSGRGLHTLSTCSAPAQLDAILQVGDYVVTNGIKIQVLRSGSFDVVEVSKG